MKSTMKSTIKSTMLEHNERIMLQLAYENVIKMFGIVPFYQLAFSIQTIVTILFNYSKRPIG